MFVVLALAAAVPSSNAAILAAAAEDRRVAAIGYRLARGGIGAEYRLCDGWVSLPGLLVQDITQYNAADRDAARRILKIGDGPTVLAVAAGSGAAFAKFAPGDKIISVNGEGISASVSREPYARMAQFESMVDKGMALGGVTVNVLRQGREIGIFLGSEGGCPSWFQVISGRSLNAQADGRYVQIGSALLRFVENDDELATVMAHELAHNVLRHRALKTPSKAAEFAADRLGVWLMARAGYNVDAVLPFWRRLEKRTNAGIFADGTHPSSKRRLAAVATAVATLKAQRSAGQSLVPPAQ